MADFVVGRSLLNHCMATIRSMNARFPGQRRSQASIFSSSSYREPSFASLMQQGATPVELLAQAFLDLVDVFLGDVSLGIVIDELDVIRCSSNFCMSNLRVALLRGGILSLKASFVDRGRYLAGENHLGAHTGDHLKAPSRHGFEALADGSSDASASPARWPDGPDSRARKSERAYGGVATGRSSQLEMTRAGSVARVGNVGHLIGHTGAKNDGDNARGDTAP